LNKHNYPNIEIIIEKALSNSRFELEPFKNDYHNKSLILEIDTLQWVLDQKIKIFNNLNKLNEIVQNEIHILRIKFNESIIKEDINTISKSIEILQICLFLIKMELEFYELHPTDRNNNNKLK
jgi:hypothetical protein